MRSGGCMGSKQYIIVQYGGSRTLYVKDGGGEGGRHDTQDFRSRAITSHN